MLLLLAIGLCLLTHTCILATAQCFARGRYNAEKLVGDGEEEIVEMQARLLKELAAVAGLSTSSEIPQ